MRPSWWRSLLALFQRRPEAPAPTWERFGETDVWSREMSAQELEADTRDRLARHRQQRRPPEWLRRRDPR